MRIGFHNAPLCPPFEYWCEQCQTLNLSIADINKCGECGAPIEERGPMGTLRTRDERQGVAR